MRIAVSACLLGEACRYDGRSKPCGRVRELAALGHELVPVCPEVAGGLSTPRTPCEIVRAPWMSACERSASWRTGTVACAPSDPAEEGATAGAPTAHGDAAAAKDRMAQHGDAAIAGGLWKIVDANGVDRTAAYERGAQVELSRAIEAGCELAILKAKSPSCGSREVYDGTFSGTLVPGRGIAAAAFLNTGIPVIDEAADFSQLSRI